jgi:glycerol uptake facilitator-like aquaporin
MQALPKRAVAETLGTAMLLAAVVGSGIMGERSAAGNVAVALLANTLATGAALVVLILTFGPISGAHINPAVTFASAWQRHTPWREVPVYVSAQTGGAILGVVVAHLMLNCLCFLFRSMREPAARKCLASLWRPLACCR